MAARPRVARGGLAALPLSTVPDKRQESKQRRAARNRANREALAARRENAVLDASSTSSSRSASKGSSSTGGAKAKSGDPTAAAAANGSSARAAAPPPRGLMGMLQSRRPGDKAVLTSLGFAVAASIYLLFHQVPADDRGEPLPAAFQGAAVDARERLTGTDLADSTVSLLDASGPQIFLVLALPIAVAVFAVWANLRPDRSRMLTFAMLAMAGSVILTGAIGIFYFPALIALAVGGFRVRKADLPARVAERAASTAARGGRRRGGAIDADSTDVTDKAVVDADVVNADVVDAEGADDAGDEVEYDPLAELEAEIESERAPDVEADDAHDAEPGRRGRPWRRR